MKIGIVTSFNEKLYNYYAYRFLETYDCHLIYTFITKGGHLKIFQ